MLCFDYSFSGNRECPSELREAVASIIFAAPRCSDLPDLLHVRNLFAAKYGKEFVAAASELRPDTSVNRTVSSLPCIIPLPYGCTFGIAYFKYSFC